MKAEFTAEELEFQNEVKTFLNDAFPAEYREKVDANVRLSKDELVNWQKILFKKGWAAPSWPKEYGGTGLEPGSEIYFCNRDGFDRSSRTHSIWYENGSTNNNGLRYR